MANTSENRALNGPIWATFLYYMLPSLVGLMALTTSSLVDGIFVGNYVGGEALAAITLLIPVFTVLFATALMFAIGGSVAAGKHIGAGDEEAASHVFTQTLMATVATAAVFALGSYGFESTLYGLLNVPASIAPLVAEYFDVIRWVLVLQLSTMVLYYFVRADGHPMLATGALVVGALGNVALDALFVVRLEMGLRGAAYALAISQVAQCAVLCAYFFSRSRTLFFVPLQKDWSHLVRASYNGVSEFINEISAGIILWLLNHLLISSLGVEGVAAFSVVNYFVFLSLMLSYGVADALHLLVSQNFGAKNEERIRGFLTAALSCSLSMGLALTTLLLWRQGLATSWFLSARDAGVAEQAMSVVLVVWPLFVINGTNVIISCYLTAIHRPSSSAVVASLRGFILPAALLVALHTLLGRWPSSAHFSEWSFLAALPLAEWITFGVGAFLCYRHRPGALHLDFTLSREAS